MATYDELKKLKEFADAMSAIPGDAPWSEKASQVAPRLSSDDLRIRLDQLQIAWNQDLKFEFEKLETLERQPSTSLGIIAVPASLMAGGAFVHIALVVVGCVLLVLTLGWLFSKKQQLRDERERFGTRVRDVYGPHRFPWE